VADEMEKSEKGDTSAETRNQLALKVIAIMELLEKKLFKRLQAITCNKTLLKCVGLIAV
jgi:hypothetical protein